MRFMMLMYPGPKAETESGPADGAEELLHAMTAFNTKMVEAGVLLAGDGLKPTSKGARVKYGPRGSIAVIDGPFTESKEVLGGYWLIKAESLADAIAWARQAPCPDGEFVEIREVYETEDFGDAVSAAERELIIKMSNRSP